MPNSALDLHNRAVRLLAQAGGGRRWEGWALLRPAFMLLIWSDGHESSISVIAVSRQSFGFRPEVALPAINSLLKLLHTFIRPPNTVRESDSFA